MKGKLTFPFFIFSLVVLTYANSLTNGFVWLDQAEILEGKLIISDFSEFLKMLFFDDNNYDGYHRPMYNLIHTMDRFIWGDNAFGYHLSSLVLHIGNVLMVYFIIMNLVQRKWTAFFIALVFGLLPCHTATVSLIHSKADLLACFFVLLTIFLFTRNKENESPTLFQLLVWSVIFLLALLSKEVSIMLPFFIISVAYILFRQKKSMPKSLLIYSSVLGLVFLVFRLFSTNSTVNPDTIPLTDRMLSFIPVYVDYVTHTLTSFELTTNDAIKIWSHMNTGVYVLYVIVFLLILSAQYYFSKKNIFIAAGFLWYNIFLIPVSQVIPILHFRADRYLYLPSLGMVVAITFIISYYYDRLKWNRFKSLLICLMAGMLIFSSFRIWDRNRDFSSDHEMFGKLILTHPECREAQGFVGNDYLEKGDYEKALFHINKALEKQSEYYSFVDRKSNYGNLGVIYMHQDKIHEALDIFKKMKSLERDNPDVIFNMGICYKKIKNFKEAKLYFEQYLEYYPNNVDALFNLGATGFELGDVEMTKKYFRKYLNLSPNSEERTTIEDLLKSLDN